jgi:ACS family tartrate transporter-like MFS transporter
VNNAVANGSLVPIPATDEALERAVRRALWRILPLLTVANVFNYLDRVNVSFAALTMNAELGLTATQFGFGAGLFYAGYVLFQIPSNLGLYRLGARRWLAGIMVVWGLVASAAALAIGPASFAVLRLLSGAAEAGLTPGIILYLSYWFPANYRARILAFYLAAIPFSSVIGGPICGLILQIHKIFGISGWRWMFILEGLPACLLGFLAWRMLVDSPADAKWLAPDEREALLKMQGLEGGEQRGSLLQAFTDPRLLVLTTIQFLHVAGSIGVGIWLPQILKSHSISNLRASMLSAVPSFFAVVLMILWARHVDKYGKRVLHLSLTLFLGSAGLVLSVFFRNSLALALIGITLAVVGINSVRGIFWTIPPQFLTGAAAAGGIAFINGIGNAGGFAGPVVVGWLKDRTGSFPAGLLALAGGLLLSSLISASLGRLQRTT